MHDNTTHERRVELTSDTTLLTHLLHFSPTNITTTCAIVFVVFPVAISHHTHCSNLSTCVINKKSKFMCADIISFITN